MDRIGQAHRALELAKRTRAPRRHRLPAKPYSALRVARTGLGLTQEELGQLSGISRRSIGLLETRKHRPRRATALALAYALRVEVSELWADLEENTEGNCEAWTE